MNEDDWEEYKDIDHLMYELSDRDEAVTFLREIDLEAQLVAIKGALERNWQAEETVTAKIEQLEERHRSSNDDEDYRMHLVDRWVDAMHDKVFQDAAYSMAAVGMLAPFVESMFVSIFWSIRELRRHGEDSMDDDFRIAAAEADFWDPHFVYKRGGRGRDLVAGIRQLAKTTGLVEHLPADYEKVLSALMMYRNKMFHLGFEWPMVEREKFQKNIDDGKWPSSWFRKSEEENKPWIFYMSTEYIEHCLKTIDRVLEGVGAFRKRQ